MDWRYAHFQLQQVFSEPRDAVRAAARGYMVETLGWDVADTSEGFEAKGMSFMRAATARFRFTEASAGTVVTVELQVERASSLGFMLFDIGGYYAGQARIWLDGIGDSLAGKGPSPASQRRAAHAHLFDTVVLVLIAILALGFVLNFVVFPVIGLFTGVLYFVGRGSSSGAIHGPWARGLSVALLLFDAFLVYRIQTWSAQRRPPRLPFR